MLLLHTNRTVNCLICVQHFIIWELTAVRRSETLRIHSSGLYVRQPLPASCTSHSLIKHTCCQSRRGHCHHHHHHHHLSGMQLDHLTPVWSLMSRSLFNCLPAFFLLVCHFSVFSVLCDGAFCLCVAISFFCIRVFFSKQKLYLVLLQFLCLLYDLCKCILLFFSCISSLLLLFFLGLLLQGSSFHCHITKPAGPV